MIICGFSSDKHEYRIDLAPARGGAQTKDNGGEEMDMQRSAFK
jgi:hypothetical protein